MSKLLHQGLNSSDATASFCAFSELASYIGGEKHRRSRKPSSPMQEALQTEKGHHLII